MCLERACQANRLLGKGSRSSEHKRRERQPDDQPDLGQRDDQGGRPGESIDRKKTDGPPTQIGPRSGYEGDQAHARVALLKGIQEDRQGLPLLCSFAELYKMRNAWRSRELLPAARKLLPDPRDMHPVHATPRSISAAAFIQGSIEIASHSPAQGEARHACLPRRSSMIPPPPPLTNLLSGLVRDQAYKRGSALPSRGDEPSAPVGASGFRARASTTR